jgi:hypothetical protein
LISRFIEQALIELYVLLFHPLALARPHVKARRLYHHQPDIFENFEIKADALLLLLVIDTVTEALAGITL